MRQLIVMCNCKVIMKTRRLNTFTNAGWRVERYRIVAGTILQRTRATSEVLLGYDYSVADSIEYKNGAKCL